MVTMLIGGLWHGANWTFVVWGAYHGLLLVMYRMWGAHWDKMPQSLQRAGTFVLVIVGWVFFRADTLDIAVQILAAMFTWNGLAISSYGFGTVGLLAIAGVVAHKLPNTFELKHDWRLLPKVAITALFALCIVVIYGGDPSPFLYFQF
jgi:alginate O-acetyltransferase complex protein AlgI